MNTVQRTRILLSIVISASSLTIGHTAFSQTSVPASGMPEPIRWTQEDITVNQKYSTIKKEMEAAKFMALSECKVVAPAQRNSCVAQANRIYAEDMASAQKYLYSAK